MKNYAIGIIFKGVDQLGPTARKASKEVGGVGRAVDSLGKKMASYGKLTGAIISAKVISRGMAFLEQGTEATVTNFVEMDQAITSAGSKFGPAFYKGTVNAEKMAKVVRGLGGSTEFTSTEVAKGLDFLAMAGINAEASLEALPSMIDLATAGQMDLARSSDIASDALGAFGLSIAPDKIGTDLQRVGDVIAKTVTSTNTTMETLFETMKMSGPAVTSLGGDIETWAAFTGKLGSIGIKGSLAGTALKNMFVRLAAPAGPGRKAMEGLGISVADASGNMRDMMDIMQDFEAKFKGMGNVQQGEILNKIFGKRAIVGVSGIMNMGVSGIRELRDNLYLSKGAVKDLATEMRKGLGVKKAIAESALLEKGFQILTRFMGGKGGLEEGLDKFIKKVQQWDIRSFADTLRQIFDTTVSIVSFLGRHLHVIEAVGVLMVGGKVLGSVGGGLANMALTSASSIAASKIAAELSAKELAKATAKRAAASASLQALTGGAAAAGTTLAGSSAAQGAAAVAAGTSLPTLMTLGVGAAFAAAPIAVIVAATVAALTGAAIGYTIWKIVDDYQNRRDAKIQTVNGMTSRGMLSKDLNKLDISGLAQKKADLLGAASGNGLYTTREQLEANKHRYMRYDERKLASISLVEALESLDARIADKRAELQGAALSMNNEQSESIDPVGKFFGESTGGASFLESLKNRQSKITVNINSPVPGLTAEVSEEEYFGPTVSAQSIGER